MGEFKQIFLKITNNLIVKIFFLFAIIFISYYITNVYQIINSKYLGWIYLIILLDFLIYDIFTKNLSNRKIIIYLMLLGLGLRIIYACYNNVFSRQHDVLNAYEKGHYGYALYIFRNNSLPKTNSTQFYQPPLNAIIQAIWMHINSLFIPISNDLKESYLNIFNTGLSFQYNSDLLTYIDKLYNTTRILAAFYSCLTLIVVYYILKEFNLKDYVLNISFSFMCFQPVLTMMAGTVNNDNLSYFFFFLSLFLAIKWFKKSNITLSILLALSIGLGMLTKLSVGFIAFLIGPIMIYKLIKSFKSNSYKEIIMQLCIFGIIVFPIGLSYSIRNLILFNQSFTYILDFGRNSWLHEIIKTKNVYERFFSFPLSQFYTNRGIFHDYQEYNIWVDLLKTATFEEFSYVSSSYFYAFMMLIINFIIGILTILAIIYIIIMFFKKKYVGNLSLTFITLFLTLMALISYISLNIKMPYSCTSNFRYISYIAFSSIVLISLALETLNNKKATNFFSILILTFSFFTTLFIMTI